MFPFFYTIIFNNIIHYKFQLHILKKSATKLYFLRNIFCEAKRGRWCLCVREKQLVFVSVIKKNCCQYETTASLNVFRVKRDSENRSLSLATLETRLSTLKKAFIKCTASTDFHKAFLSSFCTVIISFPKTKYRFYRMISILK